MQSPSNHSRQILALILLTVTFDVASAQDAFFPDDTTLDVSNPVIGNAFVGYANLDDYLNGQNGTSPTVSMVVGASVDLNMQMFNASTLNMIAGTVGTNFGSVLAYDQSAVNLSGGFVGQNVETQGNSTFNFSEGTVGNDVILYDNTSALITGGTLGHSLLMNFDSNVEIRGGTVVADIFVQETSALVMYGTDLTKTLTDSNFQGFYSQYTLTGHLLDNTDLTGRTVLVQNDSGAEFSINTVPEPCTILLVGGLLATLRLRRRK